MRSILFCTSFIKDEASWQQRYSRWLDFYNASPLGDTMKFMIDDGSPFSPADARIETVAHDAPLTYAQHKIVRVHFPNNLGRQSMSIYPGWWRSFLHSINIAREVGAQKIIHIESDAFILSDRLFEFIDSVQTGWHVLWAQRYGLPETAIQVICEDQFESLTNFKQQAEQTPPTEFAEHILPFTSVDKSFLGDRYSEFKRNRSIFRSRKFDFIPLFQSQFFWEPIPANADFATQVVMRQKLDAFRRKTG